MKIYIINTDKAIDRSEKYEKSSGAKMRFNMIDVCSKFNELYLKINIHSRNIQLYQFTMLDIPRMSS